MSSISLAPSRPVLADRVLPRSLITDGALVVAGAALTAGLAQIVIPIGPVPITGQTFAVLLVGTTLGAVRGSLSMGLYLIAGVLGAPIFAGGASGGIIGTTGGGYLVGFIAAAALVGWLAQRQWDRKVVGTVVSFLAGSAVIYAFGLTWLAVVFNALGPAVWHDALHFGSLGAAVLGAGLLPFLIGDGLKALVAGLLLPLAWKGVGRVTR